MASVPDIAGSAIDAGNRLGTGLVHDLTSGGNSTIVYLATLNL